MVQFIFEGSRTNLSFWPKFAYVLVRVIRRNATSLHDTVMGQHQWTRDRHVISNAITKKQHGT